MNISKTVLFSALLGSLLFFGAGCDSNDSSNGDDDPDEIEWNYGVKGPDRWMNLSPDFAVCGSGTRQSPIDISVPDDEDFFGWQFSYESSGLNVHNDGKTVKMPIEFGSSITINDTEYALSEIHFHTTSEHTINGVSFPGEIHFVHESGDGDVAYVAVFIQTGEENKALNEILAELPTTPGEPIDVFGKLVDPNLFLPENRTYYRYAGSLTTPPCTEGVTWIVLRNPLMMSVGQVGGLRSKMGLNFRPVQPLNDRPILQN
jgi:carbonic anhydrase